MAKLLRDNGLTIVLVTLFLLSVVGLVTSGLSVRNEELFRHGQAPLSVWEYLVTGHFLSAVFENWESEFLQMSAYVVLTAILFQRGSAESRDPDAPKRAGDTIAVPRYAAAISWLYSHSLGIALGSLFLGSFAFHWWASLVSENADALLQHRPPSSFAQHLFSSQLWFESFQNWQSEFLSTAVLVVLSIFLRQKGSPESKPVTKEDAKTGSE